MLCTRSVALIAISLALIGGTPSASGAEVADAKRAFISGMKHFDLGEYQQALDDFKNGYRAKEDPVFLYNIAQCYRLLDLPQDAIRYYRLYLNRAPDAQNRGEIEQRIQTLQARTAKAQVATPPQQNPGVAPAPVAPHAKVAEQPTLSTTTAAPQRGGTPVYKKWWLWTIVGVAAAGVGVGLGIVLTRGSSNAGTTFPVASF